MGTEGKARRSVDLVSVGGAHVCSYLCLLPHLIARLLQTLVSGTTLYYHCWAFCAMPPWRLCPNHTRRQEMSSQGLAYLLMVSKEEDIHRTREITIRDSRDRAWS